MALTAPSFYFVKALWVAGFIRLSRAAHYHNSMIPVVVLMTEERS